jgi:hypothetical protein
MASHVACREPLLLPDSGEPPRRCYVRGVLKGACCGRMSRGMATGFLALMLLIGLGVERAIAQETADLQITKVASSKTVQVGENGHLHSDTDEI